MIADQNTAANTTKTSNRRSLLRGAGALAAGAAAAALLSPPKAFAVSPALTFADIPGTGDIKVLNYALALEDLEADLYTQAFQRLTVGGKNKLGIEMKGMNLGFNNPDVYFMHVFGIVEASHRDFLRGALGSAAIPQFKYNFNMQNLTRKQIVDLVYTAEATGTGAYLGAINYLQTKTYLQIAGAIQGTEARHTAVFAQIANQLFNEGLNTAPLTKQYGGSNGIDQPIAPDTVLKAVSGFIVT
jgi:Ferritin-like domain